MPAVIAFLLGIQSRWLEIIVTTISAAGALAALTPVVLRQHGVRAAIDRYKLGLPIFGPLILQQETARFARTLGTMLRAGVPLLQAATSARTVVANQHIAASMSGVI